jgi:ribosomal protein L17
MAGGGGKYRHLGRKSSHRQALLRNLVTSLFENESITTTWHKAKEAQRLADKLITLGKKNSEASRRRALEIFYVRATGMIGVQQADIPIPTAALHCIARNHLP